MILGIFFAILSGLLWGLIFIGPLLIPEYPSILQASGRYIAFGLITLFFSWYDRKNLCKLLLQDWIEAVKLVLVGHLVYYSCLVSAILQIGAPIATAIVGVLPLIILVSTYFFYKNEKKFNQKLLCYELFISLFLIGMGLLCINISELKSEYFVFNKYEYISGIMFSIVSVICWTWYAIKNTYWLKIHPKNRPMTWTNAQGIVTLPISFCMYSFICIYLNFTHDEFQLPFGPRPFFFVFLMVIIGFFCSWLGTFCWNEASQRLSTTLIGPLIAFETIAGLIYAFIYRKLLPSVLILIGMILLVLGIMFTLYIQDHTKIK